jgi:hypothetical protein
MKKKTIEVDRKSRKRRSWTAKVTVRGPVFNLLDAANKVWLAYLNFGPVDDDRPEGRRFETALDGLRDAGIGAKYHLLTVVHLHILVKLRATPGGRGRNASHWEATTPERGWLQSFRASSDEAAVGKVLMNAIRSGETVSGVTIARESYQGEFDR